MNAWGSRFSGNTFLKNRRAGVFLGLLVGVDGFKVVNGVFDVLGADVFTLESDS